MRRDFSSAARTFLQFFWNGTTSHLEYENMLKDKVKENSKLSRADRVDFAGKPHTSPKDEKLRASGQIFQDQARLTSVHVYADGTVEYSKKVTMRRRSELKVNKDRSFLDCRPGQLWSLG